MSSNPYLPFKAPVLEKIRQTETDWTYRLGCSLAPAPGQFVEVSLPGVGECPISVSDFTADSIELTIRKVGKVTESLSALEQAAYLYIRGPYGQGFPMEKFAGGHLIIAAGGTGLAPVKSVIRHFAAETATLAGLDVLAGFRTPEDILFRPDLKAWSRKFNVRITVDQAAADRPACGLDRMPWTGQVGLITDLIPELSIPSPQDAQAIVVGPPAMMKFTCAEFLKRGLTEEQIWVSFERRMCCGLGKCGHCRIGAAYVCLDGPVFNYAEARKLID